MKEFQWIEDIKTDIKLPKNYILDFHNSDMNVDEIEWKFIELYGERKTLGGRSSYSFYQYSKVKFCNWFNNEHIVGEKSDVYLAMTDGDGQWERGNREGSTYVKRLVEDGHEIYTPEEFLRFTRNA